MRFTKYAWAVLAYNLLVVLWGAYVRASGSGAGCGSHWPLCNGETIPRAAEIATIIEFTHRLTSGLALISVVVLLVWAFKRFEKGSLVRKCAVLSVVFMLLEAAIGAGIVLFEYVAENKSIARALFMSVHLVNTFLLLAAIALTAWFASAKETVITFRKQGLVVPAFLIGFLAMLLLGVSGAVAALGDTLFPANSLSEGIAQDFSSTAHILLRLRIVHPFLAPFVTVYAVVLAVIANVSRPSVWVRRWSFAVVGLIVVQLSVGLINLVLLAPVPLQLIHLLLADFTWLSLVLLFASSLEQMQEVFETTKSKQSLNPQFSQQ